MDDDKANPTVARPFLNTRQAGHYLGLSPRHLERMRANGTGPSFRRHGRFVFYHIDDLDAWSRGTGSGENQHD
ncbi:helix-turn-helix domain-containing protein [Sphingobium fuliginis]|uniref:Helix-turn-helix domain-containing protein n=1 Tax=Sphingobium fuliginis ATCC 27551 TaxID=1208342 RepID=A0A5B8CD37_SPHSA|nr:helix-turn-helix domain-containing protein [Sphingobium fuliginis]QDC37233.1 helix-turn-helix domain-containing protein [Sphingobium fuliginis ATCC 27551]